MKYADQKKLARTFPEIRELIMEEVVFDDIFEEINKKEPLRERFLSLPNMPEEWAVEWALSIGDLDLMIERVAVANWDHVFSPQGIPEWNTLEEEWFN